MEKVTIHSVLFSFILWLLIYNKSRISYLYSQTTQSSYLTYGILTTLFCTYAFYVGDFSHYLELYRENMNSHTPIHIEPIYFGLIKNLPDNYFLWRLVIWGSAIIIWIRIYINLHLPAKYGSIALTLVLLYYFSAPRQSLAFAFLFLGLVYLLEPYKNKILTYALGCILIYISSFFHKSMTVFIGILFLAMLPFNKKSFIISIILFPFCYSAVLLYSGDIMSLFAFEDLGYETAMQYLESEFRVELTMWGWIQFIVNRIPVLFTIIYCIYLSYFKDEIEVPLVYKTILKYSYICFYIGLLFFQQDTSAFLSPRFLDASYYPLAIVLPYFLYTKYKSKSIMAIQYLFVFSNIYLFAYKLYNL